MSDLGTNVHILDAAYKPFPTFAEWAASTSIDTVRWDRYKAAIENRPERSEAALRRAYEIVKRAAAIDTGAIEGLYDVDRGFTFTVAFETTAWEIEIAKKGENVRPLFEAQLHAYDYVLDLATHSVPITEAAIRKLHEVVCEAQTTYRVLTSLGFQEQALPKGQYKVQPNHVFHSRHDTNHSYAPVDVTPAEMARLVSEMRSETFLAAHPVIQAAYAHYGLVVIHPFADGNGRVARALASVFSYRAISMPIMILSEQKEAYLDALEAADRGEFQAFVDFMLARSLDTMQLVSDSVGQAKFPEAEDSIAGINALYVTRGGYTDEQVDEAGEKLIQALHQELSRTISDTPLSSRVRSQTSLQGESPTIRQPAHRRPFGNGRSLQILFSTIGLAQASVSRNYDVWVPSDAGREDDVLLNHRSRGVVFAARIDQLTPAVSGVIQIRLSGFARQIVDEMLAELKARAEGARRKQP